MIDTHAHLNFPDLEADIDGVLERATAAGVSSFIIPGTGYETSVSGVALAERYKSVWAAVGVHPTDEESDQDRKLIEALLPHPRIVAIGEVGLDYFHLSGDAEEITRSKEIQKERLIHYCGLAKRHTLPLIVHSRECFDDIYTLLKEHASDLPFVIHCFVGSVDEARKWLDIGSTLSFTGIITYPKNTHLREVVAMVPQDRFMIETDAPFLPPAGHRGERCEPSFVRNVAECIAEVRGLSIDQVDEYTTATAREFFGIN